MVSLATAAEQLIEVGGYLHQQGWCPATSGNLSLRFANQLAITRSGVHKGRLGKEDILSIDLAGNPQGDPQAPRPSAETLLHCQLYQQFPSTGAVLHSHSPLATAFSMARPNVDALRLSGYELFKAFPGIDTHEKSLDVPIINNQQDITSLCETVAKRWHEMAIPVYLIRGHGTYVWAPTLDEALCALEAFENILTTEFKRRQLTALLGQLPM